MSWSREQVKAEVIAILEPHAQTASGEGGSAPAITESSRLVADLGVDSLGVMEIVAELEDKFGLVIPDEALREVDTIGDVVRAVEGRLAKDGRLDG
jgi:acyl carrier protein